MKITVDLDPIRKAVSVLTTLVNKRSPNTAMRCLNLTAGAGWFRLDCNNGEVRASYTLPNVVPDEPGEILIPAHRLGFVLSQLRDREIRLETASPDFGTGSDGEPFNEGKDKDGNATPLMDPPDQKVVIGVGLGFMDEIEVPAYDPERMPGFDAPEPTGWVTVAALDLTRLIDRTAYAADAKVRPGRWALAGLKFGRTDASLECVATDGRRVALADVATTRQDPAVRWPEPSDGPVPIQPARILAELAGLVSPAAEVQVGWSYRGDTLRAFVARSNDGFEFAARLLEGRFPDWRTYLPRSDPLLLFHYDWPNLLRDKLELATVSSADPADAVEFEFDGRGQLVLWLETELGRSYVRLGVPPELPAAHLALKARYLIHALGVLPGTESVELSYYPENVSLMIRAPGYQALLLTFRPREGESRVHRFDGFADPPPLGPREFAAAQPPAAEPEPAPGPAPRPDPPKPAPRRRSPRPLTPESPTKPLSPEAPEREVITT